MLFRSRRGTTWLAWAPLVWVGRVSYGGYLFHSLVLWVFGQWVQASSIGMRFFVFVSAWTVTVALASLSFRYFEQPLARRWRDVFVTAPTGVNLLQSRARG